MRKNNTILSIFIAGFLYVSLLSNTAFSQNDPQLSHFMFNKMSYNPAFAGSSGLINASILHRQQWAGFTDAPSTQLVMGDVLLPRIGGVGLSIVNDKLGFEQALNIRLMYAYHYHLSEDFRISAGLGAGVMNKSLDGSKLIYENMSDANAILNKESELNPNFDFGIAANYQDLELGLSFTQIDQSNESATFSKPPRHFYAYASYQYALNEQLDIIPSLYFKNSTFISQFEMNVLAMYDERFWGGVSYRLEESMVMLLGLNIMSGVRLGYSYDLNMGPVKSHSGGSHEIMIMASFDRPQKPHVQYRTPRFFN